MHSILMSDIFQSLFQNSIDIFYLFNNPQIKLEANFSFLLSIPVSIPKQLNELTTVSVATFPLGFPAYGQPPKPETEESITETPCYYIKIKI